MTKLPELVDGRDFFKRGDEVVSRAHLTNDESQHFYCDKNKRKKNLVFCWTMGEKFNPADRLPSWIPEDQLTFY